MVMLKLCKCGNPIPIQERTCEQCKGNQNERHKLYDKHTRDQESKAFYQSKEWKTKRVEVLSESNSLCTHCLRNKRIKSADMVDHIIPIKIDFSLRLNIKNLQPLCNSCHATKTAEDKKIYG